MNNSQHLKRSLFLLQVDTHVRHESATAESDTTAECPVMDNVDIGELQSVPLDVSTHPLTNREYQKLLSDLPLPDRVFFSDHRQTTEGDESDEDDTDMPGQSPLSEFEPKAVAICVPTPPELLSSLSKWSFSVEEDPVSPKVGNTKHV